MSVAQPDELEIQLMITSSKKAGYSPFIKSAVIDINTDSIPSRFLAVCFFNTSKLCWLMPASVIVLVVSIWLMLSPGVVYSKEMTWDLLFNLEGAWRLYVGQVPNVDFHEIVGPLNFALTVLGFQLVGLKPIAFVVGECVLAVAVAILSILAVKDRLPTLPGFLFVSMCTMLVLVPVTIGDELSNYTFAMGYNRHGWAAISILCLLLFIEPRERRELIWTDLLVASILTVGLFYLKVTYYAVAVTAIFVALLTSRHIHRYWPWWCGTLLAVILICFAPMNDGYRADIISAIASGRPHSSPFALIREFVLNGGEQIWVFGEIMVLLCLFTQRSATVRDILFGLFIWISGFFLLSQNAQAALSIPLYAVLALLLFVRLGDWLLLVAHSSLIVIFCVMTSALLPLLPPLFSNGLTLIGYYHRAKQSAHTFLVTETFLAGLAVPMDGDDIFEEVAADRYARDSFSRIRAVPRHFELTQSEYIKTVLALAGLFREQGAALGRIVVIDQVNPLAFVLGTKPSHGGNLWSGDVAWQLPEEALRDANYVAIPRFPTSRAVVIDGLSAYRDYLSKQFVQRYETPYWTVLERRNT